MEYRGNVHGVVLVASTVKEKKPWLGQLGVVCAEHTINHQRDDQQQNPPSPPYFVLDLLTFTCGDALFAIVMIHRADLFRVSPIL
jgi:hypothetical protein